MFDGQWWVEAGDLDEDQKQVMALPLNGSYLILGPPGSGKTNLLVLRANYLVSAGHPNIQVLAFTRTLEKFLSVGGRNYNFDPNLISTSQRWYTRIIHEFGGQMPSSSDFNDQRRQLRLEVERLIERQRLGKLFEVILVDEVQDYNRDEVELFGRLAEMIFVIGDSRQKVYQAREGITKARELVDDVRLLEFHYRNGIQICRLADALAKYSAEYSNMTSTCNYDESKLPSSVQRFQCRNIQVQVESLLTSIDRQRAAYPRELIGIICPRRNDLERVWAILSESDLAPLIACQFEGDERTWFDTNKEIFLCTAHSAKGLEFRAVHFLAAEGVKSFPQQRNLAYTVVTRAKTSLRIYHTDNLPGYFEQAIRTLGPIESVPPMSVAFGERG